MEMVDTRDFRKGLKILHNDAPWVIVDFQHYNPGKGASLTRIKIRNLKTGQVIEQNVKSGDKVPKAELEDRKMQYLYSDGTDYHFMDTGNYEQVALSAEEVGEANLFLRENDEIRVLFFEGKAISVEIDTFVELEVTETQPGIKGDTAQGGSKPATLETGLVVTVPLHINEGDVLKVDTRDKSYVEKVNRK